MADFLHSEVTASSGRTVRVELGSAACVRLMDAANFHRYRCGQQYRFYGGYYKHTPVLIPIPHSSQWHVVVDLNGHPGRVSASVSVL